MQGRTRILILILLIIVIVAVVAVVLLSGNGNGGTTGNGEDTPVAAQRTQPPTATDLPTPTPTEALPEIVVAIQSIPRGAIIRPEMVALREWPPNALPFNAITDLEDVIGKHARTDLYIENPILTSMVVPDLADLAEVGSDIAAIIPQGRVAVAVPMDRLTSVAYAIQPGDHVDVIVSMLYVEIDNEFQSILPNDIHLINVSTDEDGNIVLLTSPPIEGRFETERFPFPRFDPTLLTAQQVPVEWPAVISPSENPRPRLATQRTVQNALVLYVGDLPADGRIFREVTPTPAPTPTVEGEEPPIVEEGPEGTPAQAPEAPPRPDIVVLAVTPQQAVMITYMIEAHIPLTFALRAAADTSQVVTDQVTLDYIMNEYNMSVPVKQDFAIEPAIRSIRQTFVGSEITLGESPTTDTTGGEIVTGE